MLYLLYNKSDYERNQSYVEWVKEEGRNVGIDVDLCFREEIILDLAKDSVRLNNRVLTKNDIIINRTRDAQLTRYFEMLGNKVYNNSTIANLGNDKFAAYLVARNFFAIPSTVKAPVGTEYLQDGIVKKIDGFGGNDVKLGRKIEKNTEIYQEFLDDYKGDLRVYIIGNSVYATMLRIPSKGSILSNFTKGNAFEEYQLSSQQESAIRQFLEAYPMDYAGIDFFLLADDRLVFNEIEDVVGSRMLSTFGDRYNIVKAFFNYLITNI